MTARKIVPVILSGGPGTRLWPMSRPEMPKQMLALTADETMLQLTAGRALGERFAAPIVVANACHADLDPAIADLGRIGCDAERDEPALRDERHRRVDRGVESSDVLDHMVGRHHQQRLGAAAGRDRRQRDRRRGVAPHRLEDQRLRGGADQSQLLVDQIGVRGIGHHDRRGEALARRALSGELEHRLLRSQREQLLRPLGPRHRPQPRARPSRQDDRDDRFRIRHAVETS